MRSSGKQGKWTEVRIDDELELPDTFTSGHPTLGRPFNNELGLRLNFYEQLSEYLPAIDLLNSKDGVLRSVAFSEEEAKAYVKKKTGSSKFRTTHQEIQAIRDVLELKKFS